jgi:hypothetical protein
MYSIWFQRINLRVHCYDTIISLLCFVFVVTKTQPLKRRWTPEENDSFVKAFRANLDGLRNVTAVSIKEAKEKFPVLRNKSDAVLRTRMNNIVKGKQKNPM